MNFLDRRALVSALEQYDQFAVFARVEDDRLETLPQAFRDGTYVWKDVEWVVRWYCRRPLSAYDRRAEEAFRENSMDMIRAVIDALHEASGVQERIDELTSLSGVDVPIASAFLQFVDPEQFCAVDARRWRTLARAGALDGAYPDPVSPTDYSAFLRECHGIAASTDLPVVSVGRSLWVIDIESDTAPEQGRHR